MDPIVAKSARHEFTAARDENGVRTLWPPIGSMPLCLGIHARDRSSDAGVFRSAIAGGQAAERISNKPELVEMDKFLRRAGLYRDLESEVRRLPKTFASSWIGTAKA